MSAHTPGPWVVRYIAGGGYDTLSSAYRILNGPDDLDRVCEVDTRDYDDCVDGETYGEETSEQAEATAHLIAAAPEMYEALKAIEDFAQQEVIDNAAGAQEGGRFNHDSNRKWSDVLAAIAKAEGRQP
jgi:hypothetical protein